MITSNGSILIIYGKNKLTLYNLKCKSKSTLKIDTSEKYQGNVLYACISPCSNYVCVSDDLKNIYLFECNNNEWKLNSRTYIEKRCCKILFEKSSNNILVADKSGTIQRFPADFNKTNIDDLDDIENSNSLLGHVSVLTDFDIQPQERLIASSDRDEKIRISYYPDSYEIYCYLLGHEKFVSQVKFMDNGKYLMSTGGDGKLLVWNLKTKEIVDEYKFGTESKSGIVSRLYKIRNFVFMFLINESEFHVLTVNDDGKIDKSKIIPINPIKLEDAFVAEIDNHIDIFIAQKTDPSNYKMTVFSFDQSEVTITLAENHFLNDLPIELEDNERRKFIETLSKVPIDKTGVDVYFERKRKREGDITLGDDE